MRFRITYSHDESNAEYDYGTLIIFFFLQYVDREVSVKIGDDIYSFGDLNLTKEARQNIFEPFMDRFKQMEPGTSLTMNDILDDGNFQRRIQRLA